MLGCNYGVFTACLLFLIAFIALYFGKFLWFWFGLRVFTVGAHWALLNPQGQNYRSYFLSRLASQSCGPNLKAILDPFWSFDILISAIELTASPVDTYANSSLSNSSQSDENRSTQNSINETFIQKRRSEAKTRCLSIQKSEILTNDDNCPTVWDKLLCFESIRKSSSL